MKIADTCIICVRRSTKLVHCKKGIDQTRQKRSCAYQRVDFEKVNQASKMIEYANKEYERKVENYERRNAKNEEDVDIFKD